jgi:hypothetical protein
MVDYMPAAPTGTESFLPQVKASIKQAQTSQKRVTGWGYAFMREVTKNPSSHMPVSGTLEAKATEPFILKLRPPIS